MKKTMRLRIILCLAVMLLGSTTMQAASKVKYPGPKQYIWRYTLRDKQGTAYSLDHPGRWLSHKSIERRRRQGLSLDSTDLPVSARYLREMERQASHNKKPDWQFVGTSRWQNTVAVARQHRTARPEDQGA